MRTSPTFFSVQISIVLKARINIAHISLFVQASMYYTFMDLAETITGFWKGHDRKVHYLLSVFACQELGERDCQMAGTRKNRSADMRRQGNQRGHQQRDETVGVSQAEDGSQPCPDYQLRELTDVRADPCTNPNWTDALR